MKVNIVIAAGMHRTLSQTQNRCSHNLKTMGRDLTYISYPDCSQNVTIVATFPKQNAWT